MSQKCKYCGKDLPENWKGDICKSCKDTRQNKAAKFGAAIAAAALTVGSVVLKIVLKK